MNVAIVPIRDDSTRLARKATGFTLYKDYTPLDCMIERLVRSTKLDRIIFIMPETEANKNICKVVGETSQQARFNYGGLDYHMGSICDISGRAIEAIDYQNHTIVNVTGDCPLVDPKQIDYLLTMFQGLKKMEPEKLFYVSNVITRSWPDGFDVQIFDTALLYMAWRIAQDKKEITNMGWDIVNYSGHINEQFSMYNFPASEKYFKPEWGLTLDYEPDVVVLKTIYEHFDSFDFTAEEVIDYLREEPEILLTNKNCERNIPGC